MEFSIRPFVVLYGPGEAMQVFHRFTSLFSYYSFLLIKVQPTDLAVAGCGVCMMLPGTNAPARNGSSFLYWGYTSVIVLESAISRQAH